MGTGQAPVPIRFNFRIIVAAHFYLIIVSGEFVLSTVEAQVPERARISFESLCVDMAPYIQGFPPIAGNAPRVLILGLIPSRRSLEMGQYYAHPRNLFWTIMGELFQFDPGLPYDARLERLKEAKIALWDSLRACEREGSLDQNILTESETPNDLTRLLVANPSIRAIAFNGGKSWVTFKRAILPGLPNGIKREIDFLPMPSTSPANARATYEERLGRWKEIARYLD